MAGQARIHNRIPDGIQGRNHDRFQIVSAGKTLRAAAPREVLQRLASTFSLSGEQARKLFLKGWVIKDHLSAGEVVQFRTQLHQLGLKIEVHPAGTFDNRAILARLKFAKQRQERKEQPAATKTASRAQAIAPKSTADAVLAPQPDTQPVQPQKSAPLAQAEKSAKSAPAQIKTSNPETAKSQAAKPDQKNSAARQQLQALFYPGVYPEPVTLRSQLMVLPQWLLAAIVPAGFALLLGVCLYHLGTALWALPAAALAGEFGTGTVVGSALAILLVLFLAALLLYPFFYSQRLNADKGDGEVLQAVRLSKQDAPGLFLLLEVVRETCGLGIAAKQQGPKNLSSARRILTTELQVTAGAEIRVVHENLAQPRLSIGLGAVATLEGGDIVALIARALCYYRNPGNRLSQALAIGTADRLQGMQDALEQEATVFGADDSVAAVAKPFHKMLAHCGRPLVPVLDRLQAAHRRLSGPLARRLEAQADAAAAQIIGSDGFQGFAERWNRLVHADLVCGEINREAQLLGKRLANVPLAVRWLYGNLDEQTLKGIDAAMGEETDCWVPTEPAGHDRIGVVEESQYQAQLQRLDFSLQKLFADFCELTKRVSRVGGDDSCRPVENRLLLETDKESEAAQQVLAQYFNRAIPRDFLHLQPPRNSELAELDLQSSIDWLRSRLVDLQELEQRIAQLQLSGAGMQIGAALVRANVRIDPRRYNLCGTTPAATDESRQDNRVRIKECLLQRQQLHSMFFLRITRAIATMDTSDRQRGEEILVRLRTFDALNEPFTALNRYNDVVCELIERLPEQELPAALMQKYPQLISQQVRQLLETAVAQRVPLSASQLEKLKACGEGDLALPGAARKSEVASALQSLELRGKTACGVVLESYQGVLAQLLSLCLAEEARLKVKPLRLAGLI